MKPMPTRVLAITFPDDIARDLSVSRMANTRLIEADSGYEQALGLWAYSRATLTPKWNLNTYPRMAEIQAFMEVARGRQYGFLCRDHTDYWAGYATPYVGATIVPETIGTGDDVETAFQLVKSYTRGTVTRTRKITRPRLDTDLPVVVYFKITGVWTVQASGWTLDYDTGILTFGSPVPSGYDVGWAGLYDLPMRFDSDTQSLDMKALSLGATSGWKMVQIKE